MKARMDLELMLLGKRKQSEKSTYSMIQIIWYAGKEKILETFFISKVSDQQEFWGCEKD
jgi:hypothetical protein